MNEVAELEMESELEDDEGRDMGSLNHSFVLTRLSAQLFKDEKFTVLVELTLDTSRTDLTQFGLEARDELKPDICLYPKEGIYPNKSRDVSRMPEMPLLAIEVLSPRQGIEDIPAKFHAYFALGIKHAELVEGIVYMASPLRYEEHAKLAGNGAAVLETIRGRTQ